MDVRAIPGGITPIVHNQIEKDMEHEMETGVVRGLCRGFVNQTDHQRDPHVGFSRGTH